jgi:hypothetical protein
MTGNHDTDATTGHMSGSSDIVEEIRSYWLEDDRGRTHGEQCYLRHATCAIRVLAEIVDELRDEDSRTTTYVAQLSEIVRYQSHRIDRLETEVARA